MHSNLEIAELLLSNGADIHAVNVAGRIPLFSAAAHSTRDMVAALLQADISTINTRDNQGNTALHVAIQKNHLENARVLLSNGADVHAVNVAGSTPLHSAARHSTTHMVSLLLKSDSTTINTQDKGGNTALSVAIVYNHLENALIMIDAGADVQLRDIHHNTPLHYVSKFCKGSDCARVVDMLISKGAPVGARNAQGKTPLIVAIREYNAGVFDALLHREEAADVLLADERGNTPLHWVARLLSDSDDGHIAHMVKTLIDKGATVTAQNREGYTPLHVAADDAGNHNRVNFVKALLDRFPPGSAQVMAIINKQCPNGDTALLIAVNTFSNGVALELIERGADVNLAADGETPLHLAADSVNVDIARALIENGADITATDSHGNTPLHKAAIDEDTDVLKILIQAGAPLNAQNHKGFTALALAAAEDMAGAVRMLLDNGADRTIQTNSGETKNAAEYADPDGEAIKIFTEYGATLVEPPPQKKAKRESTGGK